jgi:serine kinase of HPr protein (carbohydrate metabolism regulator)
MTAPTIHATALLVGSVGLLVRGRSGAGKSALADEVIARAHAAGLFAALVADDRVALAVAHGRLIARPPRALAGLIERRGLGVMKVRAEPAAVVRAVVDLIDDVPERVPAPEARVDLLGIGLPVVLIKAHDPAGARLVEVFASAVAAA